MGLQLGFIWDERFGQVDFGPEHPVSGERYQQTYILLQKLGIIKEDTKVFEAVPATEEDLLLVHKPSYANEII